MDTTDTMDTMGTEAYKIGIRSKKTKLYYSNIVGQYIKNAITGEEYPYKVGCKEEKQLYKVRTTVNGLFALNQSEIYTAYFDNAEQYENFNSVDYVVE